METEDTGKSIRRKILDNIQPGRKGFVTNKFHVSIFGESPVFGLWRPPFFILRWYSENEMTHEMFDMCCAYIVGPDARLDCNFFVIHGLSGPLFFENEFVVSDKEPMDMFSSFLDSLEKEKDLLNEQKNKEKSLENSNVVSKILEEWKANPEPPKQEMPFFNEVPSHVKTEDVKIFEEWFSEKKPKD